MPDEIYGVMAVKNGQKQTIMNLSNARQKSYADLQTMTDAQKKGVIVCPDYPKEEFLVTADEVSYGSGTVKDALDELNSSNSGGTIILTTTPYETEADGYIWIYMTNPNHTYSVRVRGNDNIEVAYLRGQSSIEYEYHSLYVKKGMKIVCDPQQSLTDGDTVWFKPLTD